MTRMLSNRMSSESIWSSAIRHQRLCNQIPGAEQFATAMQPVIDKLKEKHQISTDACDDKSAAYDNMVLKDTILDDVVRDVSDAAKQYDRKNMGRGIYTTLFPDGKTLSIIKAPMTKEPDLAEQLLQRFSNFEEGNSMLELKFTLTTAIADARTAITAYGQSITDEKKALADEAMAQDDVVRQYEFNYLDAAKLFGKKYTNRLFPKTPRTKKEEPAEATLTE
jgi:hypothetical protein